jgi:hypothetical protein
MSRLQGRDNTFGAAQQLEAIKRFLVAYGNIGDASGILKVTVLGSDAGVV